MNHSRIFSNRNLLMFCLLVIGAGIFLRFWHITGNDFVFYDEGMYLDYNRPLLEKIQQYPPKNAAELFSILKILFLTSLMTAKWLWFFISNLRVFCGGVEAYWFTRALSAVCGVAVIYMTYLCSKSIFKDNATALLSAAIIAILPSHVFYSRMAMQESLSTLCFLGGMYLYFQSRQFGFRSILAGVLFSAVFFTNYRMIVLPVLVAAAEVMVSLGTKRKMDWIKLSGTVLTFLGIVFWIGSLNHGSNFLITFAWMTHQAQDATHQLQLLNIFSYPYDVLVLEGLPFAAVFFVNVYFLVKRQWLKMLPFGLVLVQMAVFTMASEKGARYLCVVLPFAAMAAAVVLKQWIIDNDQQRQGVKSLRWAPVIIFVAFFIVMARQSFAIAGSRSGYQQTVQDIKHRDPQAKFLVTQPLLIGLFTDKDDVRPAPKNIRDLIILHAQGYRYLVVDPQAYVSWTADGARFHPPLTDYLGFISGQMPPLYVNEHLNRVLLTRFVLDHNENLLNSMRFLNDRKHDYGAIYVYDLTQCLNIMQRIMQGQR